MKNHLTLLVLFLLIGCNSTSEKVVVSESVTPTKNTQDNQPNLVDEEVVSLEQLVENEDLVLSDLSCEDEENPFHNLKTRYQSISLVYKDKKLEYTATPTVQGTVEGIKKYFLELVPEGQYFELNAKTGALGFIPENAFSDLLVLETLQLKAIEETKVTFESNFLSQICDLSFNRMQIIYANDYDRDGVRNELDCAPNDPLAYTLHRGYLDRDRDGYGMGGLIELCGAQYGSQMSNNGSDCNDSDSRINPGAFEIFLDGIDNDCNGYGL